MVFLKIEEARMTANKYAIPILKIVEALGSRYKGQLHLFETCHLLSFNGSKITTTQAGCNSYIEYKSL
jgi:dTDP-4-amino-4,6-dideoxygalactose transaminase